MSISATARSMDTPISIASRPKSPTVTPGLGVDTNKVVLDVSTDNVGSQSVLKVAATARISSDLIQSLPCPLNPIEITCQLPTSPPLLRSLSPLVKPFLTVDARFSVLT